MDANKINDVKVPPQLTERQAHIAREWVDNEMNTGLTINQFCSKHSLSSATFTKWKNTNIDFQTYCQALKGELISSDELRAYEVVKRHILERVNSANPTEKDINMFIENFDYVVKFQQAKAMQKLGINNKGEASTDTRTVEEKKASLLSRLKG
ncbi:phBC6A51 family helix-turn-helix protein [Oceanobacillus halotolerans]|uniref:phBC6A51 family helix-turn-helix protein n=1 Tax=Oceanobacillus halotolerans TaxID=2663380 RepID=UPI0013D90770|nr:phBC6A51 family helix-turn-helix protein [Oceanobacillus halotolerans]